MILEREVKEMSKKIKYPLLTTIVCISLSVMLLMGCSSIASNNENGNTIEWLNKKREKIEEMFSTESYDDLMTIAFNFFELEAYEESMILSKRILEVHDNLDLKANLYECYSYLGGYDNEQNTMISEDKALYDFIYNGYSLFDKMGFNYDLIQFGKNQEAIDNYLLLTEDTDAEGYLDTIYNNISWAYVNLGDNENAIVYAEKSLEIEVDSITLTNLGNSNYGLGNYEKAQDAFEQAYELDPTNSSAVYGLASTYARLNDERSIDFWIIYTELKPNDMSGWSSVYRHYKDENTEEAISVLKQIIAINTESKYYWSELYRAYMSTGDNVANEALLADYEETFDSYSADLLVAEVTFESDLSSGVHLYLDLIEKHDPEMYIFFDVYYSLYFDEDQSDLLETFVIALDKTYGKKERLIMSFGYADEYYDLEMIVDIGNQLLEMDYEDSYFYQTMGYAYDDLANKEKALEYYLLSLELESSEYISATVIELLIDLDRVNEAKTYLDKVLNEGSEYFLIYLQKARIEVLNGLSNEAMESIQLAYDISESTKYYISDYAEFNDIDTSQFEEEE